MANEVGQAAPRDRALESNRITGSGPSMGGGRTLPAPGAPKPPAPPKFGGDTGFKGPSNRKPNPAKPGVTTKPLPYTGPVGGTTQKGPYTGPIGGVVKSLGSGA